MSLGWNTESALLPSRAKKIEVNNRSMADLNAIVNEKKELARLNQISRESKSLRNQRGVSFGSSSHNKDDIFSQVSNRGVESRNARDIKEKQEMESSQKNKSNLAKKVELYNKMKNGEIASEEAKRAGFLVDFKGKGSDKVVHDEDDEKRSEYEKKDEGKEGIDTLYESDDVEIEDEFGRTFTVSRFSKAYEEYKQRLKMEQTESIRQQLEEERQYKIHNHGSVYSSDQAQEIGDVNSMTKRQRREEEDDKPTSIRATQWPVSNGRNRQDCGEWDESHQAQGGIEKEGKGLEDFDTTNMGVVNGRVKSKWEFTLSREEKTYLRDIAEETAIHRSKKVAAADPDVAEGRGKLNSGGRRDVKAERRELLRKKKEARANK